MSKCFKIFIKKMGGQEKLASLLGPSVKQQNISYWLHNRVPAERVMDLVRVSNGEINPSDLRPDIYPPEDYPYSSEGSIDG